MTLVPELGTALRLHHSVGSRHRCVIRMVGAIIRHLAGPSETPTAQPPQRATHVA